MCLCGVDVGGGTHVCSRLFQTLVSVMSELLSGVGVINAKMCLCQMQGAQICDGCVFPGSVLYV